MIHYIITFKVAKKQENRKTEKTGSKTCAKYAVNCVNKEMGVGEPYWRSKEGTVYRESLKIIPKAADVYRTLSTYIQRLSFR